MQTRRYTLGAAAVVRIAVVVALVIAGPLALARSTAGTSAAWTNRAYLVAPASSGSWTAGLGTCEVVTSTAPYTPVRTCTVTTVTYSAFGDGAPDGSRRAHIYFTVSATLGANQVIKVSLNLAAVLGMPPNWNFATSAFAGGNVTAYPGFRCADMASGVAVALAPSWAAGGAQAYLGVVVENRSPSGSYTCAP